MKSSIFLPIIVSMCLFSCSSKKKLNTEIETFTFNKEQLQPATAFFDKAKSIELVQLEMGEEAVISGKYDCDILINNGEYIVYDCSNNPKVLRFSKEGKFLNKIGTKGRGPKEYIGMSLGVDIFNDTVAVNFIGNNGTVVNFYNLKGEFISTHKHQVVSSVKRIGNDTLLGVGFGRNIVRKGDDSTEVVYKAIFSGKNKEKLLLPHNSHYPFMGECSPMFSKYDTKNSHENYLFMRDAGDTIYRYSIKEEKMSPHIAFNWGEIGIGKEIIESTNPDKLLALMFQKFDGEGFISSVRYMEGENYKLGEFVKNCFSQHNIYFYKDATAPLWFTFHKQEGFSGFEGTIKLINNGKLYCLVPPSAIMDLPEEVKSKITNREMLNNVNEESNCVIVILEMQ